MEEFVRKRIFSVTVVNSFEVLLMSGKDEKKKPAETVSDEQLKDVAGGKENSKRNMVSKPGSIENIQQARLDALDSRDSSK